MPQASAYFYLVPDKTDTSTGVPLIRPDVPDDVSYVCHHIDGGGFIVMTTDPIPGVTPLTKQTALKQLKGTVTLIELEQWYIEATSP